MATRLQTTSGVKWDTPAGKKKLKRIMRGLKKRWKDMKDDSKKTGGGKGTFTITAEVSEAMENAFGACALWPDFFAFAPFSPTLNTQILHHPTPPPHSAATEEALRSTDVLQASQSGVRVTAVEHVREEAAKVAAAKKARGGVALAAVTELMSAPLFSADTLSQLRDLIVPPPASSRVEVLLERMSTQLSQQNAQLSQHSAAIAALLQERGAPSGSGAGWPGSVPPWPSASSSWAGPAAAPPPAPWQGAGAQPSAWHAMGAGGAASAWDGGFLTVASAGSHPYASSRRGSGAGEAAAAVQLSMTDVFPAGSGGLGLPRGAAGLAGLGLGGGAGGSAGLGLQGGEDIDA